MDGFLLQAWAPHKRMSFESTIEMAVSPYPALVQCVTHLCRNFDLQSTHLLLGTVKQ